MDRAAPKNPCPASTQEAGDGFDPSDLVSASQAVLMVAVGESNLDQPSGTVGNRWSPAQSLGTFGSRRETSEPTVDAANGYMDGLLRTVFADVQ